MKSNSAFNYEVVLQQLFGTYSAINELNVKPWRIINAMQTAQGEARELMQRLARCTFRCG